eukprot:TRINITY_DN11392_c0_g1_i1.p1 TRINITY_DN11392_c0_g1~~TRINITY_DN11392_c0_g1_i1.p1  ORF type:complete len:382 (-),score=63.28 TRINITY_DN11392_c0_g1_i1:58-1203(-)
MSRRNQKGKGKAAGGLPAGISPQQMAMLAQMVKGQVGQLDPNQLAELYSSMSDDVVQPLNVSKVNKALTSIREWIQSPASLNAPIPTEAIARLVGHCTKEEHMRKLYELGSVDILLEALTKLTGVTSDTSSGAPFDDAKDKQDRQKVICALIFGIGELAINEHNRFNIASSGVVVPFAINFLDRTQNPSYRFLLFKVLSELASTPAALKMMYELQAVKYFVRDGLVDVTPTLWIPALLSARPDLEKAEHHIITSAARGILMFWQVPCMQAELIKHGMPERVNQLSKTVKDRSASSFLGYLRRAMGDQTAGAYKVNQEKMKKVLTKDSVILSCSNCGKESAPDLALKKCGACGKVQYCGRECQTEHWKNGHREDCKKITGKK